MIPNRHVGAGGGPKEGKMQVSSSQSQASNSQSLVADVRFQPTGKLYCFDASGHPDLHPGDFVLIETARGQQLGEVVSVRSLGEGDDRSDLKPIQRIATGRDLAIRQQWHEKEAEAISLAREATAQLDLPIKVILAEYTFDGQRLTLLYTSEEKKLDLGNLLSQLQETLSVHVDLRRMLRLFAL